MDEGLLPLWCLGAVSTTANELAAGTTTKTSTSNDNVIGNRSRLNAPSGDGDDDDDDAGDANDDNPLLLFSSSFLLRLRFLARLITDEIDNDDDDDGNEHIPSLSAGSLISGSRAFGTLSLATNFRTRVQLPTGDSDAPDFVQ